MSRPSAHSAITILLFLTVLGMGFGLYTTHQLLQQLSDSSEQQASRLESLDGEFEQSNKSLPNLQRVQQGLLERVGSLESNQLAAEGLADQWQRRLDTVEQGRAQGDDQGQLNDLAARVEELEQSLVQINRERSKSAPSPAKPRSAPRRPAPKPAAAPIPPFRIHGTESRAGELFLLVTQGEKQDLPAIQLLAEGDSIDEWRLTRLTHQTAVFAVSGHPPQTLSVE